MPVQLGPFSLEHPFILAPMAGITHSPFRRLMRRHGSALVVSELVSANGMNYQGQRTLELLRFHEEERPVGIQIFGEDEENLCKAAKTIENLKADFVDLNLGCPVPKVVKKGAGSALCRDVPALGKLLAALVKSVRIPVTIKIRTGWDEKNKNALECVRAAEEAGVRWVAIHGRTRAQGYSGEADWEMMATVKAKSSIPIIGNGDLTTPELALSRLRSSGVNAVMIGRGALRNPFFFEQARALWGGETYPTPTSEDYLRLLEEQRTLMEEHFSRQTSRTGVREEFRGQEPEKGFSPASIHLRKFLAWYSAGFPGCHEFRRKVFSLPPEPLWQEAREFFAHNTRSRDPRFTVQPFLMGGHG